MKTVSQDFVTFLSPGTFLHEETTLPIGGWLVEEALSMAASIVERHGARPFAFYFTTRSRGDADLDSKVTGTSGRHYIGGTVLTLAEVKARRDPDDRTLIQNMEINGWERVVVTESPYRVTQPLRHGDVILHAAPGQAP